MNEVNVGEFLERIRFHNVEYRDDVLVIEPAQQLDLSEGTEAEHGMGQGRYFLNRDLVAGSDLQSGADGPVRPAADLCDPENERGKNELGSR